MEHPESRHPLAMWSRHPLAFTTGITLLGALSYGVSLLMPVGFPAVAVAAAGAVVAATGLLTALILGMARITGLGARSERAVAQGRDGIAFPGPRHSPRPAPATTTEPADSSVPSAAPVSGAVAAGAEDEPTQPLVIDLTTDDRRASAAR